MYCTHCGTPLDPEAKFCRQCGMTVVTGQATEEKLNKGMVIASFVMVLLVTINFVISFIMKTGAFHSVRLFFFITGLLSSVPYFILAYHSTIQKYKTLLIIFGLILIFLDLFSWVTKF
jgi:hypothetical protein